MAGPLRAREERYTYTDILGWEGERWELIDGVAYDMSPAPSRRHQAIVGALHGQFFAFLEGKTCQVYVAPFDVRLPNADEDALTATTVVQPDVTVVCEQEKLDDRGCLGAPTMVIEVLSPMTLTRDLREKFRIYERSGVKEYWVVLPADQVVEVFLLGEQGRYGMPIIYGNEERIPVQALEGLEIELTRVFVE